MRIQQAEGWHLWAKSRSLRRQALRRTVVNVLVILSILLTGSALLGTPAFGDNTKEMMEYWSREAAEAQASMNRCTSEFFSLVLVDQDR